MPQKLLTRYGLMALEHWKKERPQMYAQLKASGKLQQAAYQAQEMCKDATHQLVMDGYQTLEAEEITLPAYLLLPSEAEMPTLGRDPAAQRNPP